LLISFYLSLRAPHIALFGQSARRLCNRICNHHEAEPRVQPVYFADSVVATSVSNSTMKDFTVRRRPLVSLAVLFIAILTGATATFENRYPNELQGFRFYGKYLFPLRPGASGKEVVRRVLGDTAAVKRDGWTIIPTYTLKSGSASNPKTSTLAEIIIRPSGTIRMGEVKFPASFDHCHSSVSEINISFDVYGDRFGLEYWLHEQDSEWGKKGDLYRIVYGPRKRPNPPNTFCY
jgi:hypothetical protein